MSAGTITAVSLLLAELISAGVSMGQIMADVKATGKVSDERWEQMLADLDSSEALWRQAGD